MMIMVYTHTLTHTYTCTCMYTQSDKLGEVNFFWSAGRYYKYQMGFNFRPSFEWFEGISLCQYLLYVYILDNALMSIITLYK